MAIQKLLNLLLGCNGEDTLKKLEEKGFKETHNFDGYLCFENKDYKVIYDSVEKQVIGVTQRKYGDLSQ